MQAPTPQLQLTNQAHERRSFFKAWSQPEPIMHMNSITHQNVLFNPLKISIKIKLGLGRYFLMSLSVFFFLIWGTNPEGALQNATLEQYTSFLI